jgi:hypothetical protein
MKQCAEMDFSFGNPPGEELIATLASRFHLTYTNESSTRSVSQWYYVTAWPYYFLILVAPLLSGLAILLRSGRPYAIFLFLHISIMMATSMTFGGASIRYLQPISFMTLLVLALGARAVLRPLRGEKEEDAMGDQPAPVQSNATLLANMNVLSQPTLMRS